MAKGLFPTSPPYLQTVRGLHRLHELAVEGRDETLEADAVRDALEPLWPLLSEVEQRRITGLSEDLYSISEPGEPPLPIDAQAQLGLDEAKEAREAGEWDRALDTLRRWGRYVEPAFLAFLRGFVWSEAGDYSTAALFLRKAYESDPLNLQIAHKYLYVLKKSNPDLADKVAKRIANLRHGQKPGKSSRSASTPRGKTAQVNEPIRSFAKFLGSLRFTSEAHDLLSGFSSFSDKERGGMTLSGREWHEFNDCVDQLTRAVSKQESFSRRGIEKLLQTAILKAWNKDESLKQLPEKRITLAVVWLRKALQAEPKTYIVYLPVLGIDTETLPLEVGKVTFRPGDARNVGALRRLVNKVIDSLKREGSGNAIIKKNINEKINNNFRNNIIAELVVRAGDDDNAKEKAVRECRRTIDAVNFYSDVFGDPVINSCVSMLGEGNQVAGLADKRDKLKMIFIVREKNEPNESSFKFQGRQITGFKYPLSTRGPLFGLKLPNPGSTHSIESGFDRLSELLAKDDRTPLDERVLAAFQWAGRATVDTRREESFLLYMIALESLVLGGKTSSEITYQFRLKTSHLLRKNINDRKLLLERLKYLYNIRSKIVHTGSFQVTDSEVREVRLYAKQALLTVLNSEPFKDMQAEKELDGWLEEQLLS